MVKNSRIVDKKLCESYRGKPCIVCGKSAVGHHIRTKGSGGHDVKENLMPLCALHHKAVHDLGLTTFSRKFPNVSAWLEIHQWEFNELAQKWINPSAGV